MKRFCIAVFFLFTTACTSKEPPKSNLPLSASIVSSQQYTVQQTITLLNEGTKETEKQNLWIALIRDFPPYQKVLSSKVFPTNFTEITDEYGNKYAEFDLSNHPPQTVWRIEIEYQVTVNEIVYELGNCTGELPVFFTQPELHIEAANPQIADLAKQLSILKSSPCEKVRAFYNYAGDELFYSFNQKPWGAQATFGSMGADCTEYASLVIALSRAQGIPARYYEGLLYTADKEEEIAQIEHAWLDAYFPGIGWVGMDPTMGRWPSYRENYFAHYTPDHIIVTTGRNPSTLRGASYWSHLYWPGDVTKIRVANSEWLINKNPK